MLTSPASRLLVVAAHPDDETIGLGGILARRAAVARSRSVGPRDRPHATRVVVVTDGAPRDPWLRAPELRNLPRERYADERRLELARALALVDLAEADVDHLGLVDQEAALHIAPLARALERLFVAYAPDVVVTHPYEGGHPDHDACALAVRLALQLVRLGLRKAPEQLVEMGCYHAAEDGRLVTQRFRDGTDDDVLVLDAEDARTKSAMMAAHASQSAVLVAFRADREAVRVARDEDFTRPPHDGPCHYERLGWPMTSTRFAELARRATSALGLAAQSDPSLSVSGVVRRTRPARREKLTIALVPYTLAEVGTATSGGAEQVLAWIDRALADAGLRSFVVAPEGSRVACELVATPRLSPPFDDATRKRMRAATRDALVALLRRERVDVVHFHGLDFGGVLPPEVPGGPPLLATLHLAPGAYPAATFRLPRTDLWLNPVSRSQERACPPCASLLAPIPNGVPLPDVRPCETPDDYVLVLGRVCWEKGQDAVIRAAARVGIRCVVAGPVQPYPEHVAYFERHVAPHLGDACTYVGAVSGRAKSDLVGRARALVVASRVAETSSLVAMEAIASGTPVAATRAGALSEVVEDGVTGALADHERTLDRALVRAASLDRRKCRRAGLAAFDARRMTSRYLELYEELAATTGFALAAPVVAPLEKRCLA